MIKLNFKNKKLFNNIIHKLILWMINSIFYHLNGK